MRSYARYMLHRFVLFTAFAAVSTGCVDMPSPQSSAQVTALNVIVTLTRAGTTDPTPIPALDSVEIRQDDRIAVDDAGRARLLFPDNIAVELFRETGLLMLGDPQIVLDGSGSPFLQIKLEYGTARFDLPDIAQSRIAIATDHATIRAITPGAEFMLCQDETTTCAVAFSGEVEIEAQGQVRTMHGGEGAYVFAGQPPSPLLCGDMQSLMQWVDLMRGVEPAESLGAIVGSWDVCSPELVAATSSVTPTSAITPSLAISSAITSPVAGTEPGHSPPLFVASCPGRYFLNPIDGAAYVHIPGGEFTMGMDTALAVSRLEEPQHTTDVADFWIQCTEVMNAQYAYCVDSGACTPPANEDWHSPARAAYPVTHVTWQQANDYARWVGGRLPSEAEWEKACRSEDGRTYPWGSEPPTAELANFGDTPGESTPIGSYPAGASPYGVLDLSGNVWEWASSLEQPYPYDAEDGREDPSAGGERVARGGSYYYTRHQATCTARSGFAPDTASEYFGFRVVWSP